MRKTLAVLTLLLTACAHGVGPSESLTPEQLRPYQACEATDQCVRVDNGCCDCANGGATAAINRKFEKAFRNRFSCEKTICTQKKGGCEFREPVCQAGECKLGPQKRWQDKR